jgi:DNA repair protein RadC
MTPHLPLSEIPPEDRPRERLLALGARKLRNEELLAIVIGSGNRNASSLELAQLLLKKTAGPAGLDSVDLHMLLDLGGIGPAAAMRIVAGCELHRRAARRRSLRPGGRASGVQAKTRRGPEERSTGPEKPADPSPGESPTRARRAC